MADGLQTFERGALTVLVGGSTGAARVLRLSGEADAASALALSDAFAAIVGDTDEVTIDLGALTYLDSAGVRVLLIGSRMFGSQRPVVLRSPAASVRRVLDLLRLDEVFDIVG